MSLHWLVAILIAAGFGLGTFMVDLPFSPTKLKYFSWHKWIGVTVFLLAVIRVVWRIIHPPPPDPPGPAWQHRAAQITHWALYALIVAIPISGWIYSSSTGFQTVYLGLLPLPDLIAKDPTLKAPLKLVHLSLNYAMAGLVALHVAAALKHHFIDRDSILRRMLPGRST
jgi:cytochrome b561